MSRFLAAQYKEIRSYRPGEQPGAEYLKLNANESCVPPSPKTLQQLSRAFYQDWGYYCDPYATRLRAKIAEKYQVDSQQVVLANGADSVLDLVLRTFFQPGAKLAFPDVTYPFYAGYAATFGLDVLEVPVTENLELQLEDYYALPHAVLIANPNAPTGFLKSLEEIEKLLLANPERLVIVDEAYIDFGGESAIPLIAKYDHLIVIQTFSKSRNLAGERIGYAVAAPELAKDLEELRLCVNPFNLSATQLAVGLASMEDEVYFQQSVAAVIENREFLRHELIKRDFKVLESYGNFLFVQPKVQRAAELYACLRRRKVLVRYYTDEKIKAYLRISVGTKAQLEQFLQILDEELKALEKRALEEV